MLQTIGMNRQQICAALNVSESTIRRLEQQGLPFTLVGVRSHWYDLEECKAWLRQEFGGGPMVIARKSRNAESTNGSKFSEACKKVRLRAFPA